MPTLFDIDRIRVELNELPFKNRKREVYLALISEMFATESASEITAHLRQIERELAHHSLKLIRHDDDPDALFVEQQLRSLALDMSWMSEGMRWVSVIMTVALEMVLPSLIGLWLDGKFGTRFLSPLGLALGVPLGLWHLILLTKRNRTGSG